MPIQEFRDDYLTEPPFYRKAVAIASKHFASLLRPMPESEVTSSFGFENVVRLYLHFLVEVGEEQAYKLFISALSCVDEAYENHPKKTLAALLDYANANKRSIEAYLELENKYLPQYWQNENLLPKSNLSRLMEFVNAFTEGVIKYEYWLLPACRNIIKGRDDKWSEWKFSDMIATARNLDTPLGEFMSESPIPPHITLSDFRNIAAHHDFDIDKSGTIILGKKYGKENIEVTWEMLEQGVETIKNLRSFLKIVSWLVIAKYSDEMSKAGHNPHVVPASVNISLNAFLSKYNTRIAKSELTQLKDINIECFTEYGNNMELFRVFLEKLPIFAVLYSDNVEHLTNNTVDVTIKDEKSKKLIFSLSCSIAQVHEINNSEKPSFLDINIKTSALLGFPFPAAIRVLCDPETRAVLKIEDASAATSYTAKRKRRR